MFSLTIDFVMFLNLICLFWDLEDHVKQMIAMFSIQAMVKLVYVCIDQQTVYGS